MGFLDTIRTQQRSLTFRPQAQQIYKAAYENLSPWLQATGEAHQSDILNASVSHAQLYTRLSWIQIAIHNVATAAITSALKVKSKKGTDGNEKDIDNHEFEQLLQQPNESMSRAEFIASTVSYHALLGNAYWWLNRANENAKPEEMWIIPPHKLRPVPDGNLYIKGYMYDPGNGKEIPLEPYEIVHFKRFNPLNDFIGLSPLDTLQTVGRGDLAAQEWNTNYFAKDNAKLPGALAFSDPIDDDAWFKMRNDIEHTYGGTRRKLMMLRNAGKGGVQWINMSVSQKEMEFLAGRKFNRDEIFNSLAPGLISILSENATEANATAGKNTFIEFGVWPHLVHIAEKITSTVLKAYGENLIAEFEDIRVTDRSMTLAEQNAFSQVHTINEIRAEFYQDPPIADERGDLLIVELQKRSQAPQFDAMTQDGNAAPSGAPDKHGVAVVQPAALLTDSAKPQDKPTDKPTEVAKQGRFLSEKDLREKASTSKALKAESLKAHSSAMIALFMPQVATDALTMAQALLPINSTLTPVDEFHVTLLMLGEIAQMDTRTTVAIQNVLYEFAATMPPLAGRFNGIGRFQGVGDGGADALYVTFDSKALVEWRVDLVARLRSVGIESPSEHGFIPHITLGYIPSSAVTPLITLPQFDITCNDVWLALGDSQQSYALQGVEIGSNAEELADEIKRFKKWLRKRPNADVSKFASDVLTDEHKAQVVESMTITQKGDGSDQPFFTHKATLGFTEEDHTQYEKAKLEAEKRSAKKIKKAFDGMINGLVPPDSEGKDAEALTTQLQKKVKANGKVKEALAEALREGADLGTNFAIGGLDSLNLGVDWQLVFKDAKQWADEYAGTLIKQIDDTSQKVVARSVANWFESGEPLQALTDSLSGLFGEGRASVVASTETTRAAAEGQKIALKRSGVCKEWEWQTAMDDVRCPICIGLQGKKAILDGEFEGGYTFPAHPGCRCWGIPIINNN